jgi:hypothetical protein
MAHRTHTARARPSRELTYPVTSDGRLSSRMPTKRTCLKRRCRAQPRYDTSIT